MATRRSKNAENERLDAVHIEKAIELLNNKGTKKDACAILNITYNTTRLNSIIEKYLENKARDAAKRAEKRGKPATPAEVSYTIQSYLEGATIDSISSALYRSGTFINNIIDNCSVPRRQVGHSYFKPGLVPDLAIRDSFKVGEKVYSMRYDSLARIDGEFKPGVYRIFLLSDKWQEFAYQEASELASLEHLKQYGVNI